MSTFPVCIVGGTSIKRWDVTTQAHDAILSRVGRDVIMTRVEARPKASCLTWDDYDIGGRVAHHEAQKMTAWSNGILADDPSLQCGFVLCADNLLSVYTDMVEYSMMLRRYVKADTVDEAYNEFTSTMLAMQCYQQLILKMRGFWSGGVFLLSSDEIVDTDEIGDPVGSPEAVESFLAKSLLDGMGVSYVILSPEVVSAGNTMAEYLVDSLRLERNTNGSAEEATDDIKSEDS